MGVALIIGGIDKLGNSLFLTDPSGTYIPYDAVAIGANSDKVTEFLNKEYKQDITLDDGCVMAAAAINLVSETKDDINNIKISRIKTDTKLFEILSDEQIQKIIQTVKEKYPSKTS